MGGGVLPQLRLENVAGCQVVLQVCETRVAAGTVLDYPEVVCIWRVLTFRVFCIFGTLHGAAGPAEHEVPLSVAMSSFSR